MRVCILGNSLSSLALAKALVNQNIHVDLLAQKKTNNPPQSRTIGISKTNVNFFNNHIVDIRKLIWKLKKIEIYTDDLKKGKLLNFQNNNNEIFSIVKNFNLFEILEKSLSKNKYFKKVNKKFNLDFVDDYDLIVNNDFSSILTKKFFSKKITKKYNSIAFTTIISHEKIINDTAIQIFTKRGPLAFLPISPYETSIVYSLNVSNNTKEININNLINYYNFKYKIKKVSKIFSFELKSLNLRSYYHNNILAFGDLLHKIHPLAGQGFNMTIRDIKILIEIIKRKYDLGLPADVSVNREFEKKLKHNNFLFSNGIDLIYEFFNLERKTNNDILSKTVKVIGKNPSLNKFFTKIADKGIML